MNIQHLKKIADQFQFKLTEPPEQVSAGPGGGHLCWKVKSDELTYFIKQLDPSLDANDEKVIHRYELCESVALRFAQQGIHAVCAIRNGEKTVIVIESNAYLVYPWIEGHTLMEISAKNAVKIAEILARIHVINLDVPELEPKWDIHTNDEIIASIEKAISREKSLSETLRNNQATIISMNDRYLSAIPILKEKTVVTHGDIFPHNVIWQSPDQPFLIDWEAIKKWNPTREAVRTCAAWSGVGDNLSRLSLFEEMLKAYINFGGSLQKNHVEASLNGIYGSTINWLLYNVDLVCSDDTSRKDNAVKQISMSIKSGLKLTELYPTLINCINSVIDTNAS